MISTSHLIIGSALGVATGNPVGAFFVGAASHFVADALPHVDIGSFRNDDRKGTLNLNKSEYYEAYLDLIIGGIIVLFFIFKLPYDQSINAFWGAAGGISIDVIDNSPYWSTVTRKWSVFRYLHSLHEKIHTNVGDHLPKGYWPIGVATQIIAIGFSIFYLLKFTGIM